MDLPGQPLPVGRVDADRHHGVPGAGPRPAVGREAPAGRRRRPGGEGVDVVLDRLPAGPVGPEHDQAVGQGEQPGAARAGQQQTGRGRREERTRRRPAPPAPGGDGHHQGAHQQGQAERVAQVRPEGVGQEPVGRRPVVQAEHRRQVLHREGEPVVLADEVEPDPERGRQHRHHPGAAEPADGQPGPAAEHHTQRAVAQQPQIGQATAPVHRRDGQGGGEQRREHAGRGRGDAGQSCRPQPPGGGRRHRQQVGGPGRAVPQSQPGPGQHRSATQQQPDVAIGDQVVAGEGGQVPGQLQRPRRHPQRHPHEQQGRAGQVAGLDPDQGAGHAAASSRARAQTSR